MISTKQAKTTSGICRRWRFFIRWRLRRASSKRNWTVPGRNWKFWERKIWKSLGGTGRDKSWRTDDMIDLGTDSWPHWQSPISFQEGAFIPIVMKHVRFMNDSIFSRYSKDVFLVFSQSMKQSGGFMNLFRPRWFICLGAATNGWWFWAPRTLSWRLQSANHPLKSNVEDPKTSRNWFQRWCQS